MFFNPFKSVFRTQYSPFSEIVRHNFWDKVKDTFEVLFGEITNLIAPGDSFNLGVIDYLSLGVLTLPILFWRWTFVEKDANKVAKVLFPLACVLMAPVVLVRAIISGACLILSLPIIALVHGITLLFSKSLLDKALLLEVKDFKTNDTVTLGKALEKALSVDAQSIPEDKLIDEDVSVCSGSAYENMYHMVTAWHGGVELFYLPEKLPTEPSQRIAMQALLRLNLFHYTEACEKFHNPMVEQDVTLH